ncbi:MAG: GDSL family lipase [Lachnospiraceae bacterium]|nr:GDSL family lipase [Lachnospiraceae bacterium]
MRKHRLGATLLAVSLSLGLFGCGGSDSSTTTTPATTNAETTTAEATEASTTAPEAVDNKYFVTEENVRLLGRTFYDDATNVRWLTYSASGVEFEVTGVSLDIVLYGDSGAANSTTDNAARYAVYVDGERVVDEQMTVGAKTVNVFSGDEQRTATVRLVKLSEVASSLLGVKSIQVGKGTITPTADSNYYVEFVGDSITCAYGVDDEDRNSHFKTSTEDATKSYAYKTCELLNADYSLVSISGYGIVSGYTGSKGVKSEKQLMPLFYENLGYCPHSGGAYMSADVAWNFERQPDVIVVNLGTNDNSYTGSDAELIEEYRLGYIDFLGQIRAKNPDAHIICALGLMGDQLYDAVESAVASYSEASGDTNVSAYHFDPITADEGYAADWHPTEATHTRAANLLAEEIGKYLN